MQGFPVSLMLQDKSCVVIGGGKVAERKVLELLAAQARVSVISPDLSPALEQLVLAGTIAHHRRPYATGDIEHAFLVIAATSDGPVNHRIARDAKGLLNVVDQPELCNVIMPCVIRKGALTIAISSSGISPALTVTLGQEIERSIPSDLPEFLEYIKQVRTRIKTELAATDGPGAARRVQLLQQLGSSEVLQLLREKGFAQVRQHLAGLMRSAGISGPC